MILLVIIGAIFATLFVSAVLHELSHALAAAVMGLGVEEVHFGGGPVLLRAGLGRTAVQLRLLPGVGKVRHLRAPERFGRIRMFVFVAAGPASDILLFIALIGALRQPGLGDQTATALLAAAGVQAFWTIGNLFPRMVEIDGAAVPNDMMQLLQLMANTHAGIVRERPQMALESVIYEGMIQRYLRPGQPIPAPWDRSPEMLGYYVAHLIRKESVGPETIAALDGALLVERPVADHLMVLETLITVSLAKADAQTLRDLDRWSALAFELGPDIQTVRASRGSVLIETGRPAEGLALLEDGLNGEEYNDCLVHAFRALGRFKLGDRGAAEREFAQARAMFKHEDWRGLDIRPIVERIALEIGEEFKPPSTWSAEAARAAFTK